MAVDHTLTVRAKRERDSGLSSHGVRGELRFERSRRHEAATGTTGPALTDRRATSDKRDKTVYLYSCYRMQGHREPVWAPRVGSRGMEYPPAKRRVREDNKNNLSN